MPKRYFGSGTIVDPAWFNAIQYLVFDGQDLDGHYPPLTDDALSNDPNQIKSRLSRVIDEFKVSLQSGLYVRIEGGIYKNAKQETFEVSPTVMLCEDNTINYVYLNPSGTLVVSQFHPSGTLLLAVVTTSANRITSISDRRSRYVQPAGATSGIGDYGEALATLQWVKQLFVSIFYGRSVPKFSLEPQSISWSNGEAIFGEEAKPIAGGVYSFAPSNNGWYYVWAENTGAAAEMIISQTPPTLPEQQLWWHLLVVNGSTREMTPAKPGFGI